MASDSVAQATQTQQISVDLTADAELWESVSALRSVGNGGSGSLNSSSEGFGAAGGVLLRDPEEVLRGMMTCGLSLDRASQIMLAFYGAARPQVKERVATVSSAAVSTTSKAARLERWANEIAEISAIPGHCYLHAIRWARRKAYTFKLGECPPLRDFVAMLEPGDMDVVAAKRLGLFRIAGAYGESVEYHVADTCQVGFRLGSVYDCVASVIQDYPSVNSQYVCEGYKYIRMPLCGKVGILDDSESAVATERAPELQDYSRYDRVLPVSDVAVVQRESGKVGMSGVTVFCHLCDTVMVGYHAFADHVCPGLVPKVLTTVEKQEFDDAVSRGKFSGRVLVPAPDLEEVCAVPVGEWCGVLPRSPTSEERSFGLHRVGYRTPLPDGYPDQANILLQSKAQKLSDRVLLHKMISGYDPGVLDGLSESFLAGYADEPSEEVVVDTFGEGFGYLAVFLREYWFVAARLLGCNPRVTSLMRGVLWFGCVDDLRFAVGDGVIECRSVRQSEVVEDVRDTGWQFYGLLSLENQKDTSVRVVVD